MPEFLQEPRPERIMNMRFPKHASESAECKPPSKMLTIGLQEITETDSGLKVVPHKEVVFAIGTDVDPTEKQFAIMPSMARTLAVSIIAFCDAAEGKSNG